MGNLTDFWDLVIPPGINADALQQLIDRTGGAAAMAVVDAANARLSPDGLSAEELHVARVASLRAFIAHYRKTAAPMPDPYCTACESYDTAIHHAESGVHICGECWSVDCFVWDDEVEDDDPLPSPWGGYEDE